MNPYSYQQGSGAPPNAPYSNQMPCPPQPYLHNIGFSNSAPQSFGMHIPYGGMPQQSPYPQNFPVQGPGYPQSQYPHAQYPQYGGSGYPQPQTQHYQQQHHQHQQYAPPPQQSASHGYNPSPHIPAVKKPRPTVVPSPDFNPRADAEVLRKAMKGFGTDEKAIIQILTKRSNEQRLRIAFEFKTLYGKDLIKDLKSELSGNLENLVVALMTPLPQFYAAELHDALSGIGTDEDVLVEVLCTMSNHELRVIQEAYQSIYFRTLESDIAGDTSGNFRRLMVSLSCANRNENFNVDPEHAKSDAQALLRAGEIRIGTDESVFNNILCQRSYQHLIAVFHEYQMITGHEFEKAVTNEFSGDIKDGLLAIVKVVRNRASFFAERLHKSMAGLGTTDRQLIRIMVTRSEVDLADINDIFEVMYGKSLQSWIEGDCSGHYKKCLLALIGCY